MRKALITGGTGFVAKHLSENLINKGYQVIGTTRTCCPDLYFMDNYELRTINYGDVNDWINLFNETVPDEIYHLAGQSSVRLSWDNKVDTFNANLINTINMLEAIKESEIRHKARILITGSSEEYGHVNEGEAISESTILQPLNPYGVSKAALCMLMKQYVKTYGLHIRYARPFNHIGPGQGLGFVTSDFAKQIVDIEKEKQPPYIKVGNLESKRDFTDVRDIVEAYHILVQCGIDGEVYNVCTGRAMSMQYLLDFFVQHCKHPEPIKVIRDELKMRPSDYPIYYGDNGKINELGWHPKIGLEQSLSDILDYWRSRA
ncbi:hypothetical protein BBG47_24290 [Paenibacillus sp. KS1]|nr:hypothetical protein BBG47_24290 [Paenibacillus sp. KS1]